MKMLQSYIFVQKCARRPTDFIPFCALSEAKGIGITMVFYDDPKLEAIRRQIQANPIVEKGWLKLDKALSGFGRAELQEVERTQLEMQGRVRQFGGNKRFTLGNYIREQANRAHQLAFLYRMKGEAGLAGAGRIKELILLICREEAWLYQGGSGRASDLWTADIGLHLSLAYDCIRDTLSEEERSTLVGHLYHKAFLPLYKDWLDPACKIHALDTMGHNWWSVCVSGAGTVLLTLGEQVEGYAPLLHAITEGLREWFAYPGNVLQNKKANFGPDGDYIETMSYLDYALGSFMVFEDLYRRATGDGSLFVQPLLSRIPDAYLDTVFRLDGRIHSLTFGDSGARNSNGHVWLRLAEECQRADMLAFFLEHLDFPAGPLELYYYPESLAPAFPGHRAGVSILAHSGYGMIRDSRDTNDGGTLLAVKTGESWNHNHLDAGSFVLISGGREWIMDSGYCGYSKPLYNSYYRQSAAHNVVLLDGEGQPPEMIEYGTKFEGRLPAYLDAPDYRYVLADCTGPYMQMYNRFYRHFILLDGFLVMVDDLFASRGGSFQWLLHYKGSAALDGETLELSPEGPPGSSRLTVRHLYPERKQYLREQGYSTAAHRGAGQEDVFPEAEYMKICAEGENRRIKFITLFTLPQAAGLGVKVEKQADAQFQTFRMVYPDGRVLLFLCNLHADGRVMHDNAHGSFAGVETDAFLSSVLYSPEGEIERITLHNGSYWKSGGICRFSSILKADAYLDYRNGLEIRTGLTADAWCYFACEQMEEAGLHSHGFRYDPLSGLWKRKLKEGQEHIRLEAKNHAPNPAKELRHILD